MDSSDDDDSAKSIPRPIYEATSAIDSPPPHLLSGGNEMEPVVNKRLKYVVSSPPDSANGSSSSNSSTWPVERANSGGVSGGHHASLTMKLTKVTTTTSQQSDPKPTHTSTPKQDKIRVTKEMLALQRSHIDSEVLTGFVADSNKMKRRKSSAVAARLLKQSMGEGLSEPLPRNASPNNHAKTLKRSKSINAPLWESDGNWHQEIPEIPSKTPKKRNFSVAYDDIKYINDDQSADLSADDGSNSNPPSSITNLSERFRSRSKTISLSSEERQPRRGNLRSENEEFARKHNAFLDRVINDTQDSERPQRNETEISEWQTCSTADTDPNISNFSDVSESKNVTPATDADEEIGQRLAEMWQDPPRVGWDPFCWKCRKCGKLSPCSKCLRSFHSYCVRPASTKFDSTWKCPECVLVESAPKRSRRNDVSVHLLSQLLSYALERMKHVRGVYKLRTPQDVLPECYGKYFVNPVTFASLSERIKNRAFHSADEFLSDVKWMQHNALILEAGDIKIEQATRALVKVCRQEANEIDTCAECYLNANSNEDWFVKVCTHPHLLLWAKLKGFPYWPAKAMGAGPNAVVNVRFFGKHDRANVPVKDCFLYSERDPNTQTSRRSARELAECIREVEIHIEHIKNKIGGFKYAPYRTVYDPQEEQQQLEEMMPGVHDVINMQLEPANKTPLQFLIRKTAGDKLSIVKKIKATESGNESDHCGSPIKKSTSDAESSSKSNVSEVPKPKSSNYEVIPRAGDALKESRGCTVVLKRKSLETCKSASKHTAISSPTPMPEVVSSYKRKHSQSDASSETSQQSTVAEQKRRSKHARKQLQDISPSTEVVAESATVEQPEMDAVKEGEQESMEQQEDGAKPDLQVVSNVVSVVELVRRRLGVTITKIPREQQQQQQVAAASMPNELEPGVPQVDESVAKQRAVARQQQQLISKVVPFVEIKTEVLSEPEETEELLSNETPTVKEHQQQINIQTEQETSTASVVPPVVSTEVKIAAAATETTEPTAAAEPPAVTPVTTAPDIQIKEEVLSEEEVDGEVENVVSNKLEPSTTMPPPTLPLANRTEANATIVASPATSTDAFVRFVGDTTIQRVSQKPALKTPEPTQKRNTLKGVPHGPLPAAAQSPTLMPIPIPMPISAPPSPTTSPSPKSSNNCYTNRNTTQVSPKAQAQKSPVPQSIRVKCDKSVNSTTPPPTPTLNLLKSNMVVIPLDTRNSSGGNNSLGGNSNVNSLGNLTSNLMSIPVPPLRAVSKNTIQTTNTLPGISLPGPMAVPGFPNCSLPPPPLAGLTTVTATPPRTVLSTEPSGLLANALNGLPTDTFVSDTVVSEVITPGVASALSELVLRPGPPKLTARPCGPLHSDGSNIYPAQAGPLSTRLKDNAHKITDYFISVIEDTLSDLAGGEPSVLQARIAGLTLENERLKQHYERQLADMQRSTDLMISEMRKTLEQENKRVISELRQHSTLERMRAVEEAKKKQWCANCMREAQLYCCWNTSYCDYPCQQMHWQRHSAHCGQAATLQAQAPQSQTMHSEPARAKHKTATNIAPNVNQQQINRPSAPAAVQPIKKWTPHSSMVSMVNAPTATAEVLKLPSNTFLRPVALPTTVSGNNIVAPATMLSSSTSCTTHMGNTVMSGQRNTMNYAAKQAQQQSQQQQQQTIPVQRYNIPLPITVSNNAGTFGLISEQQQKQFAKSTGRNTAKNNNRARSANNTNNNNNNNAQNMRHNQLNHVFQQ